MADVLKFPEREKVMEPMPVHLEIAQLMLDSADGGLIQRSWVHAVACAMTSAYRDGRAEALGEAALVADGFRCGGCGMDGKAGDAIRALAPKE